MDSTTSASNDPNAIYSLGHNPSESGRLQRQLTSCSLRAPPWLTGRPSAQAVPPSTSGAGPVGSSTCWRARRPTGSVVGLDADPNHVEMATQMAADRNLDWVTVLHADARNTGLPTSSFDEVHGRTILITVPDPLDLVVEMTRLAKPGGWVIGLEPDVEPSI